MELVHIAVIGEFVLVIVIAFLVGRRLEQRARLRADLQMKLLDRFTAVKELEDFLQTDTGRRLVLSYAVKPASPLARIAVTAQIGVVLLVLGFGVLVVAAFVLGHKVPFVIGTIVTFLGAGLLAAAVVGRRLVKTWGMNGNGSRHSASTAPVSQS